MSKIDEKDPRAPPALRRGPRAAERIFETARELFYREGIRAVGVDEIVTKAGVTKPSLYRSFKSKDELVAAVLREVEVGFWERFEAAEAAFPAIPRPRWSPISRAWRRGRAGPTIAAARSATPWSNIPTATMPGGRVPGPQAGPARAAAGQGRRWARPTPAPWAMR
jgi:AcrR family transcriptional regulator